MFDRYSLFAVLGEGVGLPRQQQQSLRYCICCHAACVGDLLDDKREGGEREFSSIVFASLDLLLLKSIRSAV